MRWATSSAPAICGRCSNASPAASVCNQTSVARRQYGRSLCAQDDLVPGLFEILHRHLGAIVAGGAKGGFIAEVRQVRPAQPGGCARQSLEIDASSQAEMLRVNAQNAFPTAPVGER